MQTRFFTNENSNSLLAKIEGIFTHRNIHFFDALVFWAYGLSETDVLYVLDQFPAVGNREREMIQNNLRNLARGHFSTLA